MYLAPSSSHCHEQAPWVVQQSTCPSSRWHTNVAPLLASPSMVYVTVGANKGFGIADFLQRYAALPVDNSRWHDLLQRYECRRLCCGVCRACVEHKPPAVAGTRSVRVEAFEMQHNTSVMLRRVLEAAVPAGAAVRATVHESAVSNGSGTVYINPRGKSGVENQRASFVRQSRTEPRQSISLDDFFAEHLPETRVQVLSIDTEGFDGLVLQGAAAALRARRIDVLEFEYLGKGRWQGSLAQTLSALGDAGYACFWAGNGGNGGVLAQASGECWRDCFVQPDGGRWSNLICSHRADVLAVFRNDTARRVKTYPRARQKVCAANVRREGEPSFG